MLENKSYKRHLLNLWASGECSKLTLEEDCGGDESGSRDDSEARVAGVPQRKGLDQLHLPPPAALRGACNVKENCVNTEVGIFSRNKLLLRIFNKTNDRNTQVPVGVLLLV